MRVKINRPVESSKSHRGRLASGSAVVIFLTILLGGCAEQGNSDRASASGDSTAAGNPEKSSDALPGLSSLTVGYYQACAIRAGAVWCWEPNADGAGETEGKASGPFAPVQVGLDDTWTQVSTAFYSTCGVRSDDTLWCWGSNSNYGIGVGDTDDDADYPRPTEVAAGIDWASVEVGEESTCAITTAGSLWCWGSNNYGTVGNGTFDAAPAPVEVGTGTTWKQVSVGGSRACALDRDGTLWCWGGTYVDDYIAGDGPNQLVPSQTGEASLSWTSIEVGGGTVCGLTSDADLNCEGEDIAELDTTGTWSAFAAGPDNVCAITQDGALQCQGHNASGGLGNGTLNDSDLFTATAADVDTEWTAVATGEGFNCALDDQGEAWCWGASSRSHEPTAELVDVSAAFKVQQPT